MALQLDSSLGSLVVTNAYHRIAAVSWNAGGLTVVLHVRPSAADSTVIKPLSYVIPNADLVHTPGDSGNVNYREQAYEWVKNNTFIFDDEVYDFSAALDV